MRIIQPTSPRRCVEVDEAMLEIYIKTLAASELSAPDWRLPIYPAADDANYVQFIGVLNALNFCFADPSGEGKYAVELDGIPWAGATGLAAAIIRSDREHNDLCDTRILSELRIDDAEHYFRSDDTPLPLLAQRVALLNSLPQSLAPYDGCFANVVEACNYDAARLVEVLATEFPAFAGDRPIHPVTKETIVFDKRARLFALLYEGHARASAGALRTLGGIESVGPVVDYQLPRALRYEGVLTYGPELAHIVDEGILLPAGSEEEIAIRAVTYDVVERITAELNEQSATPITQVEVDFALWSAGRKAGGRHHLTLTTAY